MLVFAAKEDTLCSLSGLNIPHTVIRLSDADAPGWAIARDYCEIGKAEQLAKLLIPQEDRGEKFWSDGARAIVAGVVRSFVANHGSDWGFDDLFLGVNSGHDSLMRILQAGPGNDGVINTVLKAKQQKTADGFRVQVLTATAELYPFAVHCQKARRMWSIEDFLSREEIVVVQPDLDAWESIRPVIHAIFARTQELLARRHDSVVKAPNEQGRTWVFLDEAQFMGKIPGIAGFTAFCRSKGGYPL